MSDICYKGKARQSYTRYLLARGSGDLPHKKEIKWNAFNLSPWVFDSLALQCSHLNSLMMWRKPPTPWKPDLRRRKWGCWEGCRFHFCQRPGTFSSLFSTSSQTTIKSHAQNVKCRKHSVKKKIITLIWNILMFAPPESIFTPLFKASHWHLYFVLLPTLHRFASLFYKTSPPIKKNQKKKPKQNPKESLSSALRQFIPFLYADRMRSLLIFLKN